MQNKTKDIILDDFIHFHFEWNVGKIPVICVYRKPSDYPEKYVARVFDVTTPTEYVVVKDTLEEIRNAIPKMRFVRFKRRHDDAPEIVESYI